MEYLGNFQTDSAEIWNISLLYQYPHAGIVNLRIPSSLTFKIIVINNSYHKNQNLTFIFDF